MKFWQWLTRKPRTFAVKPSTVEQSIPRELFGSDDLMTHLAMFVEAYHRMIEAGFATPRDFQNQGGWIQSISKPDTYFIWVKQQRYYLNVITGEITKGKTA